MSIKDMIPWKKESAIPVHQTSRQLHDFHHDVNRIFDDFFENFGLGLSPFRELSENERDFSPAVSVEQTDDELVVRADLPGMDDKDVRVELTDNALVLSGERTDVQEGKRGQTTWSERRYGSFSRSIALPHHADASQAKATFSKGVLTVRIPHEPSKTNSRTIEVQAE